jgi:16S rRNA (cytidine1402-2'-O)-methyltransferase
VAVCRELTKLHEEVRWGTLGEAVAHLEDGGARGEFTVVIQGADPTVPAFDDALDEALRRIADGDSLAAAVREVATEYGVRRRALYEAALDATRPSP